MKKIKIKRNFIKDILSSRDSINKNLHKIYLIIAVVFGIGLALFMPFFNEPDGAYHYVNSSNIVGLSTDLSAQGETNKYFGYQFLHEKPNYQNGTFFEKYFKSQVTLTTKANLPYGNQIPFVLSYQYIGHVIPGIGVWLGYHIYPSLGVMIVMARLFNFLVLSIGMFFIIRYVKKGKLAFAFVALSPVVMNNFASLSYDGLSFIISVALIAFVINTIILKKITRQTIITMFLLSILMLIAVKTNFCLLLLFFPILLIVYWREGLIVRKIKQIWGSWSKNIKVSAIFGILVVGFAGFYVVSRNYGGLKHFIYKLLINQIYNFNPNINVNDINTILIQPLATHNLMPFWLTWVGFALFIAILFLEEKFVENPTLSWTAIGIFILNVLALYMAFFTGYASQSNDLMGQIGGIQGRYVTPTLLLLIIFISNSKFKIKINSYKTVVLASFGFILLSNSLLLFDTLFTILRF